MDPAMIVTAVDLVFLLLDFVRDLTQSWSNPHHQDELSLCRTQLEEILQKVKKIKARADAAGLKLKPLKKLQSELQELLSSAKGKDGCKMEDIRRLQPRMELAQIEIRMKRFEIQLKTYEELNAIQKMMVNKAIKEMMEKKKKKKELEKKKKKKELKKKELEKKKKKKELKKKELELKKKELKKKELEKKKKKKEPEKKKKKKEGAGKEVLKKKKKGILPSFFSSFCPFSM